MTIKEFKREFKYAHDRYDPWGSAMDAFFACAAQLWWNGEHVPDEWGYSPGMASDPREEGSYWYECFENASNEDLIEIGNLLNRLTGILEKKGLSY